MIPGRAPDCLKCKHYYVTWDASFPRGCRIFDFKSQQLPSMEVFRNTGRHCPSYAPSPNIENRVE